MIWPFVNAFYAEAALVTGDWDIFEHEFRAMAALALDEDKGNYNFYEIFDPETGKPKVEIRPAAPYGTPAATRLGRRQDT